MTKRLYLLHEGQSRARNVLEDHAAATAQFAALELKRYLEQIGGASLPIVSTTHTKRAAGSPHITDVDIRLTYEEEPASETGVSRRAQMGRDGFVVDVGEEGLELRGESPRALLYAVYSFLEDDLGCRWFHRNLSRIPRHSTISVPFGRRESKPALEYREAYYFGVQDGDWFAHLRLNPYFGQPIALQGGGTRYHGFVHTFYNLVPPERYVEAHPEYYSLIDGQRVHERAQLCLTNPEVRDIVIDELRAALDADPAVNIVSVSQNDWIGPCDCPDCHAIDEREGSRAGSLLHFVNQVAEALEASHPGVLVDTLAYQYTRPAPRQLRPRDNVIVRLCSIECCFAHTMRDCRQPASFAGRDWRGADFASDLEDWGRICKRLYIWDYVTNFRNYLIPFPNIHVLQDNIRFMIENNVRGIFLEGNNAPGESGEFDQLKQYLLAKLLWDVEIDVEATIWDFLNAWYGAAAPAMRAIISRFEQRLAQSPDQHVGIYDPTTAFYLDDQTLADVRVLLERAFSLADSEAVVSRLRRYELSLRFVDLSTRTPTDAALADDVADFAEELRRQDIREIRESTPLERSLELLRRGESNDVIR